MIERTLTAVVLWLLTVVTRGEPIDGGNTKSVHSLHPLETSSTYFAGSASSTPGESSSGGLVNAGDPIIDFAIGSNSGLNTVTSDAGSAEDDDVTRLPREISSLASSAPVVGPIAPVHGDIRSTSTSSGSTSTDIDIEVLLPLEETMRTTSLRESPPLSTSDDIDQITSAPAFQLITSGDSSNWYSSGTVAPSEERAAVEEITSAALSLSSIQDQAVDVSLSLSSPTSSPASSPTETSPPKTNRSTVYPQPDNALQASAEWEDSPVFYAVVAVALAGLAVAIIAIHKQSVSTRGRAATETSEMPFDMPRSTWDPSLSQVRVVINDQASFAIL